MSEKLCERIESSIRRVLGDDFPNDFSCTVSEGNVVLSGTAQSRDDATTCGVVARMVQGVRKVTNDVKTA